MLLTMLISVLLAAGTVPLSEGFESADALAAAGWPETAVRGLVDALPHSGRHCLRVDSPAGRPTYVSLFIPVESGKWYRGQVWIRCAGVVTHEAGNQNRGAVIFGQFAGAEREWVGGGSFPAGLHGDTDWTLRQFAYTRRIPENVKYLQLMLGVEGQGTAWFDDLTVDEVTSTPGPAMLEPAEGSTVDVRRPELRWQPEAGLRAIYGVELCRASEFAGEVVSAGVGKDRVRPAEPLGPGRWYWRILRREGGIEPPPSTPSWFIVADDAALWPPILEPRWSWTDAPRPTLECRVAPAGNAYDVELTIAGQPAEALPAAGEIRRWRPTTDLPPGVHEIAIHCRAGERTASLTGVLNTRPPANRVSVGSHGETLVDGQPFFPLGAYRDPSDTLTDFEGLREAGFNTTHSYAFEASGTLDQARAYLAAADQAGMKVFVGLHRAWVRDLDTPAMERWTADLMDQPGLLTWYLFDEPAAQGVPVEPIAAMYSAVRRMDPFHPASLLLVREGAFAEYAPHCDILWTDPYPIGRQPLTMVSDRARKAREAAAGKPIWIVLQAFDWAYWPDPQGRITAQGQPLVPTEAQSRVMAHLALAEGAQGLIWYWQPNSKWHIVKDAPTVWAGLKTVVGELHGLLPYMLAPRRLNEELGLPEPLLGWSATVDGQTLLVVINPGDEVVSADLPLPGVQSVTPADGARRTVADGKLAVKLGPLEVGQFRWTEEGTQ